MASPVLRPSSHSPCLPRLVSAGTAHALTHSLDILKVGCGLVSLPPPLVCRAAAAAAKATVEAAGLSPPQSRSRVGPIRLLAPIVSPGTSPSAPFKPSGPRLQRPPTTDRPIPTPLKSKDACMKPVPSYPVPSYPVPSTSPLSTNVGGLRAINSFAQTAAMSAAGAELPVSRPRWLVGSLVAGNRLPGHVSVCIEICMYYVPRSIASCGPVDAAVTLAGMDLRHPPL